MLGPTGDPFIGEYNPDAIPPPESIAIALFGLRVATTSNNIQNLLRRTSSAPIAGVSLWFQLNNWALDNQVRLYSELLDDGVMTPEYIRGDSFL